MLAYSSTEAENGQAFIYFFQGHCLFFSRIVFLTRETIITVEKTVLNNPISSKNLTTCNRLRVQRLFQEMLGELFTPVETPEAPNRGFFKGLFGGGAQSLDREELCMPVLNMHSAQRPGLTTALSHVLSCSFSPTTTQSERSPLERRLGVWLSTSRAPEASRA